MRKRFVTTLIVCLAAVLCAVGLAACGNTDSLAGKTYEYYELTVDFPEGTDEEIKNQTNAGLDSVKALYNGSTIVFEDGGKFTMTAMGQAMGGTYTKSGNNITLKAENGLEQKCTLDGDVITVKQEVSGITTNIKYKLQTNA